MYLLILTVLVAQYIVLYSADVLRGLGGEVNARLYSNLGHTVNQDELDLVKQMMVSTVP